MKKFKLALKPSWFTEVLQNLVSTFKTIEWPTLKELFIRTLVVLVISAIISAYLLGADYLFGQLRNQLLF